MPGTSRLSFPAYAVSTSKGDTTTTISKCRGRSTSFTSALKRLLPSNKPERGGTLRAHGVHSPAKSNSTPLPISKSVPSVSCSSSCEPATFDKLVRWNTANELVSLPTLVTDFSSTSGPSPRSSQQLYLDRREKRRLRRSLKESGDYLGVQGVNPATGEMDVVTPSTSTASSSPYTALAQTVQDKRAAYEGARRALRSEKVRKWEMDKEMLKEERRRRVRWTRRAEGWNSAIEPDLSPIIGSSVGSTPRMADVWGDTVVRTAREMSPTNTGTVDESVSTVRPVKRLSGFSTAGDWGIRRKPVPIRSRTLSSPRSYSDLIPVDSEVSPQPPPRPPKLSCQKPPPRPPKISLKG